MKFVVRILNILLLLLKYKDASHTTYYSKQRRLRYSHFIFHLAQGSQIPSSCLVPSHPRSQPNPILLPGTSQSGIWNNPTMRKSSPKMFRNRSKSVISLKEQKNNMSKQFDKTEVVGSLNPSSRQKLDSGQSTTKVAHRKSEIKVKDDKKDDDRRKRVAISSPDLTRRHSIDVSSVKDYNLVKSCTCDPQAAQLNVADMFSRWDNIAVVILCVVLIVMLLSAPASFFFRRRDTY